MKLLYVLNSGHPGGMEQHVLDLVLGMVGKKHTVYVWCNEGEITKWYEEAGAQVTCKKINLDLDMLYILELSKFMQTNKIDVVHAHELKASANALIAGWLAHTPVRLTHIHTPISEWQIRNKLKKVVTEITKVFYAFLVNAFGTCEMSLTESKKLVKEKEGIKKLFVLPNGLDTHIFDLTDTKIQANRNFIRAKYNISADKYVISCVSRLTVEKDHETLIRAYADLIGRYPNFANDTVLLLVGGGTLESYYRDLVQKLKISSNVIITGIFEATDKVKYYCSYDLFVFPSRAEGFGIVLLEAMCMGKPIISSDLPVLKEVGGSSVKYFETGSTKDLADKIYVEYSGRSVDGVSFDPTLKARVQDNYSMEKFVNSYENLYTNLFKVTVRC